MKFRTSRGQLSELRTAEANLICASQHIYDKILDTGDVSVDEKELLKSIAEARMLLKKQYAPEEKVDMRHHCTDKHLLAAFMQCGELIDSISRSGREIEFELGEAYIKVGEASSRALALLLGVKQSDLESEGCPKCLEDYLNGEIKEQSDSGKQKRKK